jgi:hypothetical protein
MLIKKPILVQKQAKNGLELCVTRIEVFWDFYGILGNFKIYYFTIHK